MEWEGLVGAAVYEGDFAPFWPYLVFGRNDPCPCGSGRKYKRCCLGASAPASDTCQYRVPVFNYTTAEVEREVEEARARAGR